MIHQKYINLMNQEIDGANTAAQSGELEEFLRGHAEGRTYYRELTLAVNVFEKVAMLDPPPELGAEILSTLDDRRAGPEPDHTPADGPGLWAACRGWLQYRPQPAYVFTFLGGLVFGLLVYAGSQQLSTDGDLGPNGHLSATANHRGWDHDQISESRLTQPGLSGLVRTQQLGQDLRLHLDLEAEQPALIQFSLGPDTDLRQYQAANPDPADLTVSRSEVAFRHSGQGSYDFLFHRNTENETPILMSIFSEGRLIHSESLTEQEK